MASRLDRRLPHPTSGNAAPLGQVVRLIAGFSGFLGHKCDGHPGPKALLIPHILIEGAAAPI